MASPATSNTLVVHPGSTYGPASANLVGGDLLTSSDITLTGVSTALNTIGFNTLRWPQGTIGNVWHYPNVDGTGACHLGQNANSTPAAFLALLVSPVTQGHMLANEASNAACNAGNTLADVEAQVNGIINTTGCGATLCKYWTLDNEQYESNAISLSCNHVASCYATNFATMRTGMQGVSNASGINVCVDADPQRSGTSNWDSTVFNGLTFDCADAHYYGMVSGGESDSCALSLPIADSCGRKGFSGTFMTNLKADLAAGGSPNAAILIGEYSTVPSNYTTQTQSIIQALFNAEMIGEASQDGVTMLEFHSATVNCQNPVASSLYGNWLTFSGSMSLSNGANCFGQGSSLGEPAAGTILAPGDGIEVASNFTQAGETIIKSTLTDATGDLVAYCSTFSSAYSVMIINRSQFTTHQVIVSFDGHGSGTGGNIVQYSKAIFDLTQSSTWNGPTTTVLSPWTTNFTLSIPPWSVTVVHSG
jgi:hypothetical protein